MLGIGGDFERWVVAFTDLNVRAVLEPAWTAGQSPEDPRIWEVWSQLKFAESCRQSGLSITAFAVPTGHGNADADILIDLGDQRVFADVYMCHEARGSSVEELRAFFRRRSEGKAAQKFPALTGSDEGVVVNFCFAQGQTFDLLSDRREEILAPIELTETPRCSAFIFAIMGHGPSPDAIEGLEVMNDSSPSQRRLWRDRERES